MEIEYKPQERLSRIIEILAEGALNMLSSSGIFHEVPFLRVQNFRIRRVNMTHFVLSGILEIKRGITGYIQSSTTTPVS